KSGAEFAIARAPFYAIKRYPLARKSMGGVAVDTETRVMDLRGKAIPGLYAVGEVTGFARINGRAALEGTFLGPSVLMGRIAGRTIAGTATTARPVRVVDVTPMAATFDDTTCTTCHPTRDLVAGSPGRLHTAGAHSRVVAQAMPCSSCHAELHPYRADQHRSDPLLRSATCGTCHLPPK
ncbi:MAG TPA: FAD-binding protein, partial [Kofleriaceae bacterium]